MAIAAVIGEVVEIVLGRRASPEDEPLFVRRATFTNASHTA
jgi:hypothetical protein